MWNSIKDLPGANTFMPLIAAALLWFGVHAFYVAPEILAPRLAKISYHPACENTLSALALADNNQQQQLLYNQRQQQNAKQRMATNILGGFAEMYFGRDFVERYKDDPLVKGIRKFSKDGIQLQTPDLPVPKISQFTMLEQSGYCGCVIAEKLGQRISTGLYSASLRFWKPENIRQLETLSTHLIPSQQCNYTPKS